MSIKHFLTLDDLPADTLQQLINRAIELKALTKAGTIIEPLKNKTLAMIFTKSSTRTRVSFEVGMRQLGGGTIHLSPADSQMSRGEPVEDTARVVSSMVDAVMIRTDSHQMVETFAEHSRVPVINGLTDDFHPCQLLADLQTMQEVFGSIANTEVAWVGDGNNVCHSWMNAARIFNFRLRIATPTGFAPSPSISERNKSAIQFCPSPSDAIKGADVVVTDTWASMGQEDDKHERAKAFANFTVSQEKMQLAKSEAIFMHCLPAYRGMEVTTEVIEGKQSKVFQEAENRLHAQKALLEYCLR